MKKTYMFFIALFCGITMISNAQIPNSGFEDWTAGEPDGWTTSNIPIAGLINITQTTDSYSGTYAVRGEVVNFAGTPWAPVIQSGPGATGFAISEKYLSFELYYKFTSNGGDKFSVNVGLEKEGTPVAQGAVALPADVSNYTYLSVPLNYMIDEVPDWAFIQISITGPITGPDVHLGSLMYVDELSFSLLAGIGNTTAPGLTGKCYPNPAADIINIPLNENVSGEVLIKIFDTYGKEVKSIAFHQQQDGNNFFQFSVENLSSGLYFYSIDGQRKHDSGKFNVSRL
jgi:hypothetical protein